MTAVSPETLVLSSAAPRSGQIAAAAADSHQMAQAAGLGGSGRRKCRVAVVGFGAAGIIAARELRDEGHEVVVFEQRPSLGGIWDYCEEREEEDLLGLNPSRRVVHSSCYESLRTNLPREIMGFSDLMFTPAAMGAASHDPRRFPLHTEVLAYLKVFMERNQLEPLVRFNTSVVCAVPVPVATSGKPEGLIGAAAGAAGAAAPLQGSEGSHGSSEAAGAGQAQQQPPPPEPAPLPVKWLITSRRAAASGSQEGAALAAGFDQGQGDLVTEEYDALVSCTGCYWQPNMPQVQGLDVFPGKLMHCHNYRQAQEFAGQEVVVVGASFSGDELMRQVAGVARFVHHSARTWTVSETQCKDPSPPNSRRLGMLVRLTASGSAVFACGTTVERVDSVVFCTGYKYCYPWLEEARLVETRDMHVAPLYKHVLAPSVAPTLAFIGLLWKSLRFPQFEMQGKWVARLLSGRAAPLPAQPDMEQDTAAFLARMESEGVPVRYMHNQSGKLPKWMCQWPYNDWLTEHCGPDVQPVPAWKRTAYSKMAALIFERPSSFRDDPDLHFPEFEGLA